MAAYAALLSLARTTDLKDLNRDRGQYFFSLDAEEKIRSIHEYVMFLLSFFDDLPEKASRMEGEIRDVAHKIEEIIEHFMWQKMKASHTPMKPSIVKLEDQLQNVTVRIGLIAGEMMEERPAYLPAAVSLSSISAATGNDRPIGLDEDLMAIKERLCRHSSTLQIIPIVGMGGIGKTTLARTLYDDSKIREHFDIRAWVTISLDYNAHRLRNILLGLVDSIKLSGKQLCGEKIDESEVELKVKVHQTLKQRRFLIVMDDVWGIDIWDDVMSIIPDDNNGSRIMLTTRLSDVAAYTDSDSSLHEMRLMDDNQSWNLLKQKVFSNSYVPPNLENVGKEIARRCAGLPLAVVLIAGVLSAAKNLASWEEIAENVNPVVGQELGEILSLSYTHLPHHLRPCFLFIGGFPEDEIIRASRLVNLWVAEGFLKHQNEGGKSLEDEAEGYLEDLVKRNLVLVASRKSNGKIKSCSLHDTVRDLCVRQAHEEKFLHVMRGSRLPQVDDILLERRISLNRYAIDNIWCPTVRTILCFQRQEFSRWQAFLRISSLLKVLNTVGNKIHKEFPSQVFELFHLTYLALVGSFQIPSAISNLVNLQTLIIYPTFQRKQIRNWRDLKNAPHHDLYLPLEIWRMARLRHVILYDLYKLPHPPHGSNLPLQNLQTLSTILDLGWNEEVVEMIPNVKELRLVYHTYYQECNLHHLMSLQQLEKLEVYGYRGFSWRVQNLVFPPSLKKLTLGGGGYPWEEMGIIGSLPNLQVLKLVDKACNGETWETSDEQFLELRYLLIDGLDLQEWITDDSSHFPQLKCLVLRSCLYLREIPKSIGDVPTLEQIEVCNCRRSVSESAELIEQEQGNDVLQVRIVDQVTVEHRLQKKCSKYRGKQLSTACTDEDLMAIKERLCGHSSTLQIIPIVGMGGIGKTTLARTLYDDSLIREHFDIRAWVTISQDYNAHRLRNILLGLVDSIKLSGKQLCGEKIDESEIALKVYQTLKGKRFLIVMDDVWGRDFWDDVRSIIPDDNNGSRIMLTTRLLDVAAYPHSGSRPHEMRLMDDDQSWNLLKQKVFPNNYCPADLEHVGREIARKCAGLPLAVVLVAGVLSAVSADHASWEEIAEDLNPVVGEGLGEILSFSYTHLHHHLRPCFLYIGVFPENEIIRASSLVDFWVSEGFLKLQNEGGESLEDEAEGYLEDLVKRNLVLVASRKSNGKIKSCSLHDTVRDWCVRQAREEMFLHVMRGNRLPQVDVTGAPSLASLFTKLQITEGKQLPNWRGLKNAPHHDSYLPLEIWRMARLRHVILYDLYRLPHPPHGSNLPLQNLQTLSTIFDLGWNEKVVEMIPNVKELRLVYHTDYQECNLHHLMSLPQLENLEVYGYRGFSWRVQNLGFPPSLTELTLGGGEYPWEEMGIIGSLPNLQVLRLLDKACTGETWETSDEQFLELRYLLIDGLDLQEWITERSHFPRLTCLGEGGDRLPISYDDVPDISDSTGDDELEIEELNEKIRVLQQHLQRLIAARDDLQRKLSPQPQRKLKS